MPLLQTLEIHEIISAQQFDTQRAVLKRQVRDVANGTRNFAMGLRRRMNALSAREDADAEVRDAAPQSAVLNDAMGDAPAEDGVADLVPSTVAQGDTAEVGE